MVGLVMTITNLLLSLTAKNLKVGRHLAKLQRQIFDSTVANGAFLSYRVHLKTFNVTLNDF